jgi:hypothetical protein
MRRTVASYARPDLVQRVNQYINDATAHIPDNNPRRVFAIRGDARDFNLPVVCADEAASFAIKSLNNQFADSNHHTIQPFA